MDEEFLEETHKQTPNLLLTQLVYQHEIAATAEIAASLQTEILAAIEEDKMAPYYDFLCAKYGWTRSDEVYNRLTYAKFAEYARFRSDLRFYQRRE